MLKRNVLMISIFLGLVFFTCVFFFRTYIDYSRIIYQRDAAITFSHIVEVAVAVFHVVAKDMVATSVLIPPLHTVDDVDIFAV